MSETLDQFKASVYNLFRELVQRGDSRVQEVQTKLNDANGRIALLTTTVQELTETLENRVQDAVALELAKRASEQSDELKAFLEGLQSEFNPTPVSDVLVELVKEDSAIVNPPVVDDVTTLGTSEPTEQTVTDAALEAALDSFGEA